MKHLILIGFSDAMDRVFLVGACVLVIAIVLSAMLKEVPLRTMSGLQAARAADAADAAGAAPAVVVLPAVSAEPQMAADGAAPENVGVDAGLAESIDPAHSGGQRR